MTIPQEYPARLVAALDEAGVLGDPAWRAAVAVVPRHLFIPRRFWWLPPNEKEYVAVDSEGMDEEWLELAYSDQTVVTQVDDRPDTIPGERGRVPSSSATLPRLVVGMLDDLRVRDGMRVLEIGTGSGYSSALLCERLGDSHVVTVEIDAGVAERAQVALKAAGYAPTMVTGDGAVGYPAGAPYDRVIATCAVRHIPYAWVEQTRPGGLIVAPLAGSLTSFGLVRLEVAGDGTAVGRMLPRPAGFMWLRAHRAGTRKLDDILGDEDFSGDTRRTRMHPGVLDDEATAWVAGLAIPWVRGITQQDETGVSLWLVADRPADGSIACVDADAGAREFTVTQAGPRRLWDRVEETYRWWEAQGRPPLHRFGVTVTPQRQYVWYDHPESGQTWDLPT